MKPKKIQLSIENSCSQDWNSMTINEQGKFCDHCAKSVIDLTKMSDRQIVQMISANPGKICGRAKSNQLNRIMEERSKLIVSPYKFAVGLFIAGSSHSFAAPKVQAKMETVEQKVNDAKVESPETLKDSLMSVVEGVVLDQNGEVMVGVVIKILDSKLGAVSDMDGKFKFVLPDTFDLSVIVLHPEYVDATGEDVIIDRRKPPFTTEIHMKVETDLTEIGLIVYKPKRWWQFWK